MDRVALVAGATRGAGRAIAVELARAGCWGYIHRYGIEEQTGKDVQAYR